MLLSGKKNDILIGVQLIKILVLGDEQGAVAEKDQDKNIHTPLDVNKCIMRI